jgi:hypothetical protein
VFFERRLEVVQYPKDTEVFESPDPPIQERNYWYIANWYAEELMRFMRLLGFYERRNTMFLRCENPACIKPATNHAKFLDPRRSHDVIAAYTVKYFCSQECELAIVDELERQAQYARLT